MPKLKQHIETSKTLAHYSKFNTLYIRTTSFTLTRPMVQKQKNE